jgi:hypothetical protein
MNVERSHGKYAFLTILLVIAISFQSSVAYTAGGSSVFDPQAPQEPIQSSSNPYPYSGVETVLLIQDNVPWGTGVGGSPYGAVVDELLAQSKRFCMITSSELSTMDLSPFKEIIIPSAQAQTFYDNLFPGGMIDPKISDFVYAGGVLSANLADHSSGPGADGNWDGATFVAGVGKYKYYSNDLSIADPSHRIITAMLPCSGGNIGHIVDVSEYNDLDGWGWSSHGNFVNLPSNAKIILTNATGYPVFIEYAYGDGTVLATMTTSEIMYIGLLRPVNKKLLANEICYQDYLVREPPVGGTLVSADTLGLLVPGMGLIFVAGAMIVLGSKRKEK